MHKLWLHMPEFRSWDNIDIHFYFKIHIPSHPFCEDTRSVKLRATGSFLWKPPYQSPKQTVSSNDLKSTDTAWIVTYIGCSMTWIECVPAKLDINTAVLHEIFSAHHCPFIMQYGHWSNKR